MADPFFQSLMQAPDYDGQLVAQATEPGRAARYAEPALPLPPALEKALVLTPSSFGLQPWRFVVVVGGCILRPAAGCWHAVHGRLQHRMSAQRLCGGARWHPRVRAVPF